MVEPTRSTMCLPPRAYHCTPEHSSEGNIFSKDYRGVVFGQGNAAVAYN